jgi:outer membrane protein TolC
MRLLQQSFLLLFLLTTSLVHAQQQTLNELIDKAMVHNQSVKVSQLAETQTQAQIREVKAGTRPQVNVSGDYKRYLKIPGQVVPATAFGGPEGQYQVLAFGLPYNLSTTLQVAQPLYNPSVGIGLKAAKVGQEVASLQTMQTKEDVSYNVSVTYYNLQTVAQQRSFLRSNLAATERLIKLTDLLYQNQLIQGIDVDRLRISYTQSKTQLASLEASYGQLHNALKFLTGTPQSDSLEISLDITPDKDLPLRLPEQTINRTDLLLLNRQQALNNLNQRNTKAGVIPTLSAYGVANSTYFGQGGDNSVFKHVPGYWVGLQLNWNLYDGSARRARLSGQKIESQKLALQTQQAQESIFMEVANARNQFTVEQSNLAASQEGVTLAEKVYTQKQLQFKEGTTSLTEVIQAETALQQAQNTYLSTLVKLRTAELDWKKATGTIIPK